MIVLHACWSDGALRLWGEHAVRAGEVARASAAPGDAAAHPFGATHDELAGALAGDAPHQRASVVLSLPSDAGLPLPSASLAHRTGHAERSGPPALAKWDAPCLAFAGAEGGAALIALDDAAAEPVNGHDRPVLGDSVRFFACAARFARALLADQRFVAWVAHDGAGEARASWRPWLADKATAQRARALALAMPPAARAGVDALQHDRGLLLEEFLGAVANAEVRAALRAESFLDAVDGRDQTDPAVAWLAGLLGESRTVSLAPDSRASTIRGVRQWIAGLEDRGAGSSWRLCLRLDEPTDVPPDLRTPGENLEWELSFHLQSADDPEETISAEEAWSLGDAAVVRGRRIERPQELLLGELARAARLYPTLEEALESQRPVSLTLTTSKAYEFLREHRPILIEQGFGAIAPEWWDAPTSRLGARLQIESEDVDLGLPGGAGASGPGGASASVGLESLVGYRWQIAVGDTALTLKEFESLAAQRAPLIRVAGQWVEIRQEDVTAAVKFLRENPGGQAPVSEALRLAFAWDAEKTGLPILGMDATGWVAGLLSQTEEKMPNVAQPAEFHGALRPYQLRGLAWLAFLDRFGLGACLADDMGLGKTVQLLALLAHERTGLPEGHALGPTLVVAPMSVVENWVRETRRFAPKLRTHVHHGALRPQGDAFADAATTADVTFTTYALAHRDRESLGLVKWRRVVLDEAQNVKNAASKQSQAVRALAAPRRIALTGTPVENRLSELWSIMDFCNPKLLGSHGEFRRRFAAPIERTRDKARGRQLRSLVQPFVLRRLKTDPLVTADLPAKVETKVYTRLTPEQATLYEAAVKRMLTQAEQTEGIRRRGVVLASLVRLKQICNHPSQLLRDHDFDGVSPPQAARSGKSGRLIEMLEEVVSAGDSALVFTQFRQMGRLLQAMLAHHLDREILFMHGGVSQPQRQAMIDRFQKRDGTAPIFLLSLKAGGVGLNLTAASHVFHYDRWWNPAVENQATDRAHRIGQTRTVQVHKFVVSGTLEERIDEMIEQKTDLAQRIIGAGEQWLTELSTAQLRDLVTLGADAIEDDEDDVPSPKAKARSAAEAEATIAAIADEPEEVEA